MTLEQTAASRMAKKSLPMTTSTAPAAPAARPRRNRRRLDSNSSSFTSYLVFGLHATCCLCLFLIFYVLILACLFPLLEEGPLSEIPTHRGQVLRPVMENVQKRIHGNRLAENMVGKLRQQFDTLRKAQDLTDTKLMDQALDEFEEWHKQQNRRPQQQVQQAIQKVVPPAVLPVQQKVAAVQQQKQNEIEREQQAVPVSTGKRNGFAVLGMHRSGTSMLSGLLVQGCGYKVGGPLIGGAADNEKGFFELVDAVLQNDEFMGTQNVYWANNVGNYDSEKALKAKEEGRITFKHGEKALKVLNDPDMVPWLQKDPRMCITLKTWLPLLNTEPAVIFTYRHPLEVAQSLKKREQDFPLERGLRLWLLYNIRALQNSANLCRVYSSNEAVLADTLNEVQKIADELTSKCNVPAAPRRILKDDVERFVDLNLQHNKGDSDRDVIEEHGDCKVREYDSDYTTDKVSAERERVLYLKAMKLYCDLKSGDAYKADYAFPPM